MFKETRNICLFVICSFLSLPVSALTELSGSLESFLKNIDYGEKYSNSWVKPTPETQANFSNVIDAFVSGDYNVAHELGNNIGYEVIRYSNTDVSPNEIHYILWESAQTPNANFIGGGTYVAWPNGANVVLQAPHPQKDAYTAKQSIETYLHVKPALLMIAGTRRDNSTAKSACTNGDYNNSDVAHQTESLFYTAHQRVSDYDISSVFIQFHGFGSSSLSKLKTQCGSNNSKLINLSEGINYPTGQNEQSIMQILRGKVVQGGIIEACVYGNDTSSLGGTWNVEARYTNDSNDACISNAQVSSKRFVHLEQSYDVRNNYRKEMSVYILEAITEYFQ